MGRFRFQQILPGGPWFSKNINNKNNNYSTKSIEGTLVNTTLQKRTIVSNCFMTK